MKQRLIGAAVLIALAVIFLPMLVQGPAPDSGISDVPLSMPDTPAGTYETRDLPLVTPEAGKPGGAVGMPAPVAEAPAGMPDASAPDASTPTASTAVPMAGDNAATATALPADNTMFPPATAGGDYAVHFGSFASSAAAQQVVNALRASQLPGYKEQGLVSGKPVWRVRVGPYASRADAEAARLRAAHVRDDVGARVITLDATTAPTSTTQSAGSAPPKPSTPAATTATTPATTVAGKPAAALPSANTPTPPVMPPVSQPAAVGIGFAVQLAAYSKPADATALRDKVRAAGFSAFTESVSTDKGTLTRVRVGPVATRVEADALKAQVKAKVGVDGIVRPHP